MYIVAYDDCEHDRGNIYLITFTTTEKQAVVGFPQQ